MTEMIAATVLLFLIMDPLGNLPIFMSVLKHLEPKRRRVVLIRELLIALILMLIFSVRRREDSVIPESAHRNRLNIRRYHFVLNRY